MLSAKHYEERAEDVADQTRRYLIILNSGGIVVTYGIAGALVNNLVSPKWTIYPVIFFSIGLVITISSLLVAKIKAVKRQEMSIKRKKKVDLDNLKKWYWGNWVLEIFSTAAFIVAIGTGLYSLNKVAASLM